MFSIRSGFAKCEGSKEGREDERCSFSGEYYFQACSVNPNRIVSRLKSGLSFKYIHCGIGTGKRLEGGPLEHEAELCRLLEDCFVVTRTGKLRKKNPSRAR